MAPKQRSAEAQEDIKALEQQLAQFMEAGMTAQVAWGRVRMRLCPGDGVDGGVWGGRTVTATVGHCCSSWGFLPPRGGGGAGPGPCMRHPPAPPPPPSFER